MTIAKWLHRAFYVTVFFPLFIRSSWTEIKTFWRAKIARIFICASLNRFFWLILILSPSFDWGLFSMLMMMPSSVLSSSIWEIISSFYLFLFEQFQFKSQTCIFFSGTYLYLWVGNNVVQCTLCYDLIAVLIKFDDCTDFLLFT